MLHVEQSRNALHRKKNKGHKYSTWNRESRQRCHAKTRQQMFHVEQMSTNDKDRGEYGIESHFTDK